MTDASTAVPQTFAAKAERDSRPGFVLEETHWGYIVCAKGDAGRRMGVAQSLSLLAGAGFLAATLGMWLLPSMMFSAEHVFMRFFLRYRNSDACMTLATGRKGALSSLRDRISHDVALSPEASANTRGVTNAA